MRVPILPVDPASVGQPSLPGCAAAATVLALLALAAPAAGAVTHTYSIEIPHRVPIKYKLDLDLKYPGQVTVEANWTGNRVIALRLDPPVGPPFRRSGPSPQRLEVDVDAASMGQEPWILTVHSVPTSGVGQGTLSISLPDPPRVSSPASHAEQPGEGGKISPRERQRPDPDGLPLSWARLFETIDRFRSLVVYETGGSPPDACRWHADLLSYLRQRRDVLLDRQAPPTETTQKLLLRIAAAVERVEAFRTTDDPLMAGPPPDDRELRTAWIRMHRERLGGLKSELDALLESIRRGYAPELAEVEWPSRMASCLIACQRHFEERARLGERNAINWELARSQWDVMLVAADALRGLTELNTQTAAAYPAQP